MWLGEFCDWSDWFDGFRCWWRHNAPMPLPLCRWTQLIWMVKNSCCDDHWNGKEYDDLCWVYTSAECDVICRVLDSVDRSVWCVCVMTEDCCWRSCCLVVLIWWVVLEYSIKCCLVKSVVWNDYDWYLNDVCCVFLMSDVKLKAMQRVMYLLWSTELLSSSSI